MRHHLPGKNIYIRLYYINAIRYANLPANETFDICPMTVPQLEKIFLLCYESNWFSTRTRVALGVLYGHMMKNPLKTSGYGSLDCPSIPKEWASITSTRTKSVDSLRSLRDTESASPKERRLTYEKEYKTFGENYAIFLTLKKWQRDGGKHGFPEFNLTFEQLALYKLILLSFALGGSPYSNKDLLDKFKFPVCINESIQGTLIRLGSRFETASDHKTEWNIQERQDNIRRIIATRKDPGSIIIQEDSLDNIVAVLDERRPTCEFGLLPAEEKLNSRGRSGSGSLLFTDRLNGTKEIKDRKEERRKENETLIKEIRTSSCCIIS